MRRKYIVFVDCTNSFERKKKSKKDIESGLKGMYRHLFFFV